MQGPGEGVHLRAGIVDVIFLADGIARLGQKPRQRITDHRAATMAHMHGAGRIGGNVFDVDLFAPAQIGVAISNPCGENVLQPVQPKTIGQAHINKAGAGGLRAGDLVQLLQLGNDQLR